MKFNHLSQKPSVSNPKEFNPKSNTEEHPKTQMPEGLNEQLQRLIAEACHFGKTSAEGRKKLNQIVRLMTKSGKIWRENSPYYGDVLHEMWIYFFNNLEKYDPSRGSVITWFNYYFCKRLQKYWQREQQHQRRIETAKPGEEAELADPIDALTNRPEHSDNPLLILETTKEWVDKDADGELKSVHIKGRPDVNCQILLQRRLPPETRWEELSEEFGLSVATLASFYRRQCLPRLQKFGESEGYL